MLVYLYLESEDHILIIIIIIMIYFILKVSIHKKTGKQNWYQKEYTSADITRPKPRYSHR